MIFVVLALVVAYMVFLRHIIRYSLSQTGLDVRWLGMRVVNLPYEDVVDAKVISFRESMNYGMRTRRLGNRFSGPVVVVRRRSGWVRDLLLTPERAEAFVGDLNRRAGK